MTQMCIRDSAISVTLYTITSSQQLPEVCSGLIVLLPLTSLLLSSLPVSYTHLDVYKRQM